MSDDTGVGLDAPSTATEGADLNPADSLSQAEPTFVIDETPQPGPDAGSPQPPAAAAGASAQAPPPQAPPDYQEILTRAQTAERRANEMMAQMQPFVRRLLEPNRPAVDPNVLFEKLKSGSGTPEDLALYLQVQQQQLVGELSYAAEQRALSAASEQTARGRFAKEQMGDGRDFDTMRQHYLQEAYQQNPALRQMLHAAAPQDPAFAEYVFAVMSRVIEKTGNDPIRGLKAVLDAVEGPAQARVANEVVRNINQAARQGAQRVMSGEQRPSTPVRKIRAEDIWKMSDKEFEAFERQHGPKF